MMCCLHLCNYKNAAHKGDEIWSAKCEYFQIWIIYMYFNSNFRFWMKWAYLIRKKSYMDI